MRDRGTETEHIGPQPPRQVRAADHDESGVARAAAATGQGTAIGPSDALGLQRAAGNAGLTSALGSSSEEATVQRAMGSAEEEQPLYPSHGEGEDEI